MAPLPHRLTLFALAWACKVIRVQAPHPGKFLNVCWIEADAETYRVGLCAFLSWSTHYYSSRDNDDGAPRVEHMAAPT